MIAITIDFFLVKKRERYTSKTKAWIRLDMDHRHKRKDVKGIKKITNEKDVKGMKKNTEITFLPTS